MTYHRTTFNYEYLLIVNCEFSLHSQLIDSHTRIGFAIWSDLAKMQYY